MQEATARPPVLSVAPMVRHSHRHARRLWALLCPAAVLHTEMQPARSFIRRAAALPPPPDPAVLQLAGDDPAELAAAAALGARLGFAGLNLNCGCPSPRATAAGFGACMMARPRRIGECLRALRDASGLPVTLKCRLGVDKDEPAEALPAVIDAAAAAGAAGVAVHLRSAWLKGVNPRANRSRPPLRPEWGPRIKRGWPQLQVVGNGGVRSVAEAEERCAGVDGVMLGRAIVSQPLLLAEFATRWFGRPPLKLAAVLERYFAHCVRERAAGVPAARLLQPLYGLLHGRPRASRARAELAAAA
ncbi:MAG: tRNA-dihydrouridine synthase, partial [Betaproteobacteria bacterium AqS2]|nr:tRNA-dihydrouridine synthase [Betaproteobacteria bacterium AqS2]